LSSSREQEIERLFREYGKGVGSYALARLGDPELAEEISSRVFLQVVRCFHQRRGPTAAWLWAIVRNELARHFRSPLKRKPLDDSIVDGNPLPPEEIERREKAENLREALDALDEVDRELIGMKFYMQMSNQDIGVATGLSASNVGVRLYRALQRLRGLITRSHALPAGAGKEHA
jgi:RNA polymerase sigma-70 factor (ECF subfamily)